MRKIALITALFIQITSLAIGQGNPELSKQLLSDVKTKYSAYSSIQIKFKYTLVDKVSDMKDERLGTLYLKKDKFKLQMDDVDMISNNVSFWLHLKKEKQVQVQDYDPTQMEEEFGFSPTKLFDIKESDFESRLNGEVTLQGKQYYEVEVSPKDKTKSIFKIKMYINKTTKEVGLIKFFDKSGVNYDLEILEQVSNQTFTDDFFTFNSSLNKDVKIEDLRDK